MFFPWISSVAISRWQGFNFNMNIPLDDWIFFCSILEHVCPLFVQIAQMGLILPRWDLILPRIPPPPQNTPFPGLIFKVGKMNYCLRKLAPIWAKCLKSGQNFSRSGPNFFIHEHLESCPGAQTWPYVRAWRMGVIMAIVAPPWKCPKSAWTMNCRNLTRKYLKTKAKQWGIFNPHPQDCL